MIKQYDMIVAADGAWSIGSNNAVLYKIPEDIEFFKKMTYYSMLLCGSTTFKSFPNGWLPKRSLYVLTNHREDYVVKEGFNPVDCCQNTFGDMYHLVTKMEEDANNVWIKNKKPIVVGGASVYEFFMQNDMIDRIFVTQTKECFTGADSSISNPCSTYGFEYNPMHPLHVVTGYEDEHISEDGQYHFTIKTLTKAI